MSMTFIRGGTLFSAFFIILAGSMLFTTLGGSASTGSDKNTSSQCSVGFFVRNVTETSGNVVLVCSQVGWTQLTGFPSGCVSGTFVIAVGATLTCSNPEPRSTTQCSTTGQLIMNVTESSTGVLTSVCVFPDWTKLINFPSGCAAGQFVRGVGVTLTCSTIAWSNITGFPSACPAGQFVSAVGTTLTCSTPTGAGGVSENGRFSVTYPFTTLPGLLGSRVTQDVVAFNTKSNVTLKVWYGAGFANGTSGTGNIVFRASATSSVPTVSRISDTVDIHAFSGDAVVVTPYPVNATIVGGHVISVTDNDTNPYTFRGAVDYTGIAGLHLMEIWTTFAATTTTLHINVTYNEKTCCYVEVSVYSGVGSFGTTISHSSTYAGACSIVTPCTETATLTGGLATHVLAGSELWHDCADTQTEGAAQTVRSGPSACQNVAGRSIMARSSDRPEVTGSDTYSFSLTSCTSCYTGVIAIDLIPGVQSQGFIDIYDSTAHSLIYEQNIIVVPTAGDSLAVAPLLSHYFAVGHIITFRVSSNSASSLTISGIVVISLLVGNV